MTEFPLVVRRGVPGRLTDVISKTPIGFYCKKCHHFEFEGMPTPRGKEYILIIRES